MIDVEAEEGVSSICNDMSGNRLVQGRLLQRGATDFTGAGSGARRLQMISLFGVYTLPCPCDRRGLHAVENASKAESLIPS